MKKDRIEFQYTNYRGEYSVRYVIPERIWFGATEFHPEPQWILTAFDLDKKQKRDFALSDCDFANIVRP